MIKITLARFLQTTIGICTLKIATHFLPPSEIGVLYILWGIQAFVGMFLIFPVEKYVYSRLPKWQRAQTLSKNLFYFIFYVGIISFASFLILINLKTTRFSFFKNDSLFFIFIFAISLIANSWNAIFPTILNILGNTSQYFFWNLFGILTGFAGSLIAMILFSHNSNTWFLGQVFGQLTSMALGLIFYSCFTPKISDLIIHFKSNSFKPLLGFIIPVAITAALQWIISDSYKFFMAKKYSYSELGYVGVGFTLSLSIGAAVDSLFMQLYHPSFYQQSINKSPNSAMNKLLKIAMPYYSHIYAFALATAPVIILLLTNKNYKTAYIFLSVGIIFTFFRSLVSTKSLLNHTGNSTHQLIFPNAVGALITLFLVSLCTYFILPPIFIILSIAMAMLIVLAFLFFKTESKNKDQYNIINTIEIIPYLVAGFCLYQTQNLMIISIIMTLLGIYLIFKLYRWDKNYHHHCKLERNSFESKE